MIDGFLYAVAAGCSFFVFLAVSWAVLFGGET